MGDVQFETPGEEYSRPTQNSDKFEITGLVLKTGLTSSRETAGYILLGIAALAVVITFIFWPRNSEPVISAPAYQAQMQNN